MRVAVYARYSSENQREASIEDQTRNCEKCATQEGWSVTHRYQDKAISGSTNARPGYQQLLADAEGKCFDIVLVDDFSRLSRDQVESEQVRRRMVHWGCRLIGVTDGIDTASKGHKLQAGMKGSDVRKSGELLHGHVADLRHLVVPEGFKDWTEWKESGATAQDFKQLLDAAQP
jgi:site-specific DNA recombinase